MKTYSLGAAGKSSKGGEKKPLSCIDFTLEKKLQDNVSLFLGTLGGKIRAKITDLVHQSKEKMTDAETALSILSLPHLNTSLSLVKFTASTQQKKMEHTRLVFLFCLFPIQITMYKLIFFNTCSFGLRLDYKQRKKPTPFKL